MSDSRQYGRSAAEEIAASLRSVNELDSNYETANVVDGLFFLGRSIKQGNDDIADAIVLLAKTISETQFVSDSE